MRLHLKKKMQRKGGELREGQVDQQQQQQQQQQRV